MAKPAKPKRHYEKRLSLHPLTFDQALTRILAAKPVKRPAPKPAKKKER